MPLLCHCQPLALGADVTLFKDPEKKRGGVYALCNQAAEAGIRELEGSWDEPRSFLRKTQRYFRARLCVS